MSKTKILGGNYSIFVAPSWANSALEAPVLGVGSTTGLGYGDLYVQPIVLGGHGGLPPISLVAFAVFVMAYIVNLLGRE